jgi:hypothetical protein
LLQNIILAPALAETLLQQPLRPLFFVIPPEKDQEFLLYA